VAKQKPTNSYRQGVFKTFPDGLDTYAGSLKDSHLLRAGLELSTAVGQVGVTIMQYVFSRESCGKETLVDALGAVRWCLEYLCVLVGTTIEDVEKANRKKLKTQGRGEK